MNTLRAVLILLACALFAVPALAQEKKDPPPPPPPAVTEHTAQIGGRAIDYTVTAGTMEMPDYQGKTKAHIFYIAYIRAMEEGSPPRPVTFTFNGGPGSSSVWLHLGALGPRRVQFADPQEEHGEPALPLPPYQVVNNEYSWLDFTDLVFIDPVSTGYSRPVEGERKEQFHGLQEDIQWMGDFIRLWTTRNQRWNSPKFLAGESYGTTRCAGLSGYLQDTHGMYLHGISLISPVLNFQTIRFDEGNDTPYWLFLPTYTATAWYHGRLPEELQQDFNAALREAEIFARTDYLLALARGDELSGEEREQIARQLSRLTGLSPTYIKQTNLRIHISNFTKELLRDADGGGRTVGRFDSRYTGIDRRGITASPDYDPSYAAIQGAFTGALNHYMRGELRYENDHPYEILTGRVHPWNYASANNRYVEVGDTLRSAMTKNRALKVLVAAGYYDLATPYFAADYTVSHLGLPPEVRGNIVQTYYHAGHMMYLRHQDLEQLRRDAEAFYEGAVGGSNR